MTPDQTAALQTTLWRAMEITDRRLQRDRSSEELERQDWRALGVDPAALEALVSPLAKSNKADTEDSSVSAAVAAATSCATCAELSEKLNAARRRCEILERENELLREKNA